MAVFRVNLISKLGIEEMKFNIYINKKTEETYVPGTGCIKRGEGGGGE